jgi:hypothetical protein
LSETYGELIADLMFDSMTSGRSPAPKTFDDLADFFTVELEDDIEVQND